jgi:glycosyltransferase involved in cell wall biosynthesis
VAAEIPNVHWLIVGQRTSSKPESREFEQRLHRIAKDPPLCGRVHFLGNRHDVAALLSECTLLLHAARQEPLGRVLLEAAAAGLPVIATDVGGTREIFPTENDGAVLVPTDDTSRFGSEMISLLRDNARRERLAAGARRRAEVAFDIRQAADRLIQNYRNVLN